MVSEESVHFPALQLPKPGSFLLLGGGLSGHITEASKYQPEKIDYCEADPWIYQLGKSYFGENTDLPFRFIPEDGRTWLMRSGDTVYDVIISNSGNPLTIGSNRYFTLEFYRLVRQHLSPGGVFCMHLTTAENYVNEEEIHILAINDRTLQEVFPHVLIVPGTSTYFLASDRPMSLDFPGLLSQKQIPTSYVHPDYLDANHILFDSDQLTGRIRSMRHSSTATCGPGYSLPRFRALNRKQGDIPWKWQVSSLAAILFLFLLFRYSPGKTGNVCHRFYRSRYPDHIDHGAAVILWICLYGGSHNDHPVYVWELSLESSSWKKIWRRSSMIGIMALVLIMALLALSGLILPFIRKAV